MRIDVRDLSAGYGSAVVVRNVTFSVESGESLAILGRNGMGKTTLIRALLSLIKRRAGSVELDGTDTRSWPTHKIVRTGIGYGPQDAALFPDQTVIENLTMGALHRRDASASIDEAVKHFPVLAERLKQAAGTLSGGEQKMLILARALAGRPQIMILDEISEGLQPSVVATARAAIAAYRAEHDTTLILVEQSVDMALASTDRVALMQRGEITDEMASAALDTRTRIEEAFAL